MKAVKDAAQASRLGAEQTVDMLAVHGRAAIKGQNSRGMIDPGAVTISLLIEAMYDYLSAKML